MPHTDLSYILASMLSTMRTHAALVATVALATTTSTLAITPLAAQAQSPPGLYDEVTGLNGNALRGGLHGLVDHHRNLGFNDIWPLLVEAHAVTPTLTTTLVLDIYYNHPFPSDDYSSGTGWARKHAWPKARGFPDSDEGAPCNVPYTDAHLLFPADSRYNSSKSDLPYDDCPKCTPWAVDGFPDTPNRRSHSPAPEAWEVWPGRRGDVARALLYADVQYEGDAHGSIGRNGQPCREPNLVWTDDRSKLTRPGVITDTAFMGILTTLIRWNFEDSVDDRERFRNDLIARPSLQGNRNPLVDRPEFVCEVWLGNRSCRSFVSFLPSVMK